MDIERRAVLLAGLTTLMSGCARATQPAPQPHRDIAGWADFKARFLDGDGRVIDTGNGGISHSEGQGYAMVVAEAAGDRAAFERLHGWTEKNLARPHDALFSWRYDPRQPVPVNDPNNASDGDILIAWALMRAGRRWGQRVWQARARDIRMAIHDHLVQVRGPRTLLLPGITGFDHPDRTTINPSYYIWPALDQFRAADGDDQWGRLIRDGERLIVDARFGPLALPTDWIDIATDGRASPAADKPALFGLDAIRVPLYLTLGGRQQRADAIARFWRSYIDQKRPVPAWVDVRSGETASFAVSAGGCAVVRRLLGDAAPPCSPQPGGEDYYSSVLRLIAAL